MTTMAKMTNSGASQRSYHLGKGTATAGGTGDNTLVACGWIDKTQGPAYFRSAKLVISFTAVLGAGNTASFTVNPKDATSSTGTGAAAVSYYKTTSNGPTIVATGPTGGGTVEDTVEYDLDLSTTREFIGADITPDLSAANTDTLAWRAVLIMGGAASGPVTKSLL